MRVHFIGIGGSGVSGLSLMARSKGYDVSGCDLAVSTYFSMVQKEGVDCVLGHSPDHIDDVDILVRSSAVPLTNPEVVKAAEKEIEILTRGEFLARLVENSTVIGVTGSHGKTSTSWIIYYILKTAGLNPSVYTGGKSAGQSNITKGDLQVIELDESDGSVFEFLPDILLVNNLEFEHPDYYKTPEKMLNRFEKYLLNNKPQILVIGRGFDLGDALYSMFNSLSFPTVEEIRLERPFENIEGYDFFMEEDSWYFLSHGREIFIGTKKDPTYVLQNRSAALLVCETYLNSINMQLPDLGEQLWESVLEVERRFEVIGKYKDVFLIDDYAHHPSEVLALAEQAKLEFKSFGMIFQPHRYTRFNTFYSSFVNVFSKIEPLIVVPVFSAGEKESGMNSRMLYEDIRKTTDNEIYYFDSIEKSTDFLRDNIKKLRIFALITVGAGDVNMISKNLVEK